MYILLLFCGVNVPLDLLPGWMEAIGRGLPLTHGIEAAREVVGGASLASVRDLVFEGAGRRSRLRCGRLCPLPLLEAEGRRRGSLEVM